MIADMIKRAESGSAQHPNFILSGQTALRPFPPRTVHESSHLRMLRNGWACDHFEE